MTAKRPGKALAGKPEAPLALAATGMEAELELWIDGERCRPEDVFGDPTAFVRGELMHRQGTSYHLPTGGALYFDTGVIEVATPVIEIERGAAARAGRQLWEAIRFVRGELDAWERGAGAQARLAGFSMHYNVSFELPRTAQGLRRTLRLLALLLTYILPFPVMLLATNRRSSTGVGVRPRGNRLEVTADFTPEPALSIATGSLILGIVRAVMSWPSYELSMLERMEIPVVAGFAPEARQPPGLGRAPRRLPGESFRLRRGQPVVAAARRPPGEPARARGSRHPPLLALDPPSHGSVQPAPDRRRDARPCAVAARPPRPPAGLRGRRPAVHLGRSLSGAPAEPLALRAGAHPRRLRPQAAPRRALVHAGQRPRLDRGRLPARRRHDARLPARLPGAPSPQLGASAPSRLAQDPRRIHATGAIGGHEGASTASTLTATRRGAMRSYLALPSPGFWSFL
jgi:hypothetical protein